MTDISDWSNWMDAALWEVEKALRETPYDEDCGARALLYRAIDRVVELRGELRHYVTNALLTEEINVAEEERRISRRELRPVVLQAGVEFRRAPEAGSA